MEEKLRRLVQYGKQVGLQVNVAKTKLMRINTSNAHTPLYINGEPIEEVEASATLEV